MNNQRSEVCIKKQQSKLKTTPKDIQLRVHFFWLPAFEYLFNFSCDAPFKFSISIEQYPPSFSPRFAEEQPVSLSVNPHSQSLV